MSGKLLAGLCAIAFASLSTAAFADCAGHTAQTSTPIQTAQVDTPDASGSTEQAAQE